MDDKIKVRAVKLFLSEATHRMLWELREQTGDSMSVIADDILGDALEEELAMLHKEQG